MLLPVLVVFAIGGVTGVSLTTNEPKVAEFGQKYLAAPAQPEKAKEAK